MPETCPPLHRVAITLNAEARAIQQVQCDLDHNAVRQCLELLEDCNGKVVVTGMGKIGYVGQRFAATLASTGTPAFFVHPGEAQHGDLGMLGDNDILVALSNSGKTREVYEMAYQAQRAFPLLPIVVFTGHADSVLARYATCLVSYGEINEACPLGLTPTTSMAVVGALLDGIALAVMEQKGVTREQYARRHHGGYLGQKARGHGTEGRAMKWRGQPLDLLSREELIECVAHLANRPV